MPIVLATFYDRPMFGVFGFVLKLGMQHETARNPIHCIQIEFILIGRFK